MSYGFPLKGSAFFLVVSNGYEFQTGLMQQWSDKIHHTRPGEVSIYGYGGRGWGGLYCACYCTFKYLQSQKMLSKLTSKVNSCSRTVQNKKADTSTRVCPNPQNVGQKNRSVFILRHTCSLAQPLKKYSAKQQNNTPDKVQRHCKY